MTCNVLEAACCIDVSNGQRQQMDGKDGDGDDHVVTWRFPGRKTGQKRTEKYSSEGRLGMYWEGEDWDNMDMWNIRAMPIG